MSVDVECTVEHCFGDARDQGRRPTCMAFALSALNQVASSAPEVLSVEYLYRSALARRPAATAAHDGLTLQEGLVSVAMGQPVDVVVPYAPEEPTRPVSVPVISPDADLYRSALTHWQPDLAAIATSLRGGNAVGLGIRITNSFTVPNDGVVSMETHSFPGTAHAVVAVAIGHSQGQVFVRVRNSWGFDWGDAGHAWLPWAYLELHTLCVFGNHHGSSD